MENMKTKKETLEFNRNEDAMRMLISDLKQNLQKTYLGGGKKKIEKLHSKNKMTARERIDALIDEGTETMEIGALTANDMYKEYGGCPSGGVITVVGYVKGRLCMIVSNDATVKAGAWFPITGKNNLRAQEIAIENNYPLSIW